MMNFLNYFQLESLLKLRTHCFLFCLLVCHLNHLLFTLTLSVSLESLSENHNSFGSCWSIIWLFYFKEISELIEVHSQNVKNSL